ncbi:hypothetical protein SO802_019140 [Lithocarpus litseifolius]|uniref:NADP-dependent oxidoreductase domain-containing protein n=1 Tax=Lithocarpus litseifolius TaxID=425828 RepID=A0AAW2CMU4_9ROSI
MAMAMAATVKPVFTNLSQIKSTTTTTTTTTRPRASVKCCAVRTEETQRVTLANGNDSIDICRVLNGMWQTSGGWGRIDRDDAVEAMLRYADSGLSTFDMADHCQYYSKP